MICEKCRMKLSDDMKFCPVCGTAVSKSAESPDNHVPVCRKCGASLLPDARFCLKCGSPVGTVPQSKSAESPDNHVPVCRKCGASLLPDARFCLKCGSPVGTVSPTNHQLTPKPASFTREEKRVQKRKKQSIWYIAIAVFLITAIVGTFIFSTFNRNNESSYNNRYRYTVMELEKGAFGDNHDNILIDSEGNIITVNAKSLHLSYIGDNGVAAGSTYKGDETNSDESLFIIKDGQYIEITNKVASSSEMDFQLCGSGKKLFYRETDEKIYSYDIENGITSEIHEGTYIEFVSYDGNVVTFGDEYCKIGDKSAFWAASFANYVGASDSGKNVYFNKAYHRGGNGGDGSNRVEFAVINAASHKDGYFPNEYIINESESIYTSITAHNNDYSEILFEYDGDTYFYNNKKRRKTLICNNALLYPVEGIRLVQSIDDKFATEEGTLIDSWKQSQSIAEHRYDQVHSVDIIKKHVYFKFNDDEKATVSLVYLNDDLTCQMLVEDVTADPVISSSGNYIWAISGGNEIYRIDMTGREPKTKSIDMNGLSIQWFDDYNSMDRFFSAPIALCDGGESAYCIADVSMDYENNMVSGTLYRINMDDGSISMIDNDVVRCISDERDRVYYLNNNSPEQKTGSLYSYSQSQGKKQITRDAHNIFMINSSLFVIKPSGGYNLYKLEDNMLHLVADNIHHGTYYRQN